jgi:hypothetical protein
MLAPSGHQRPEEIKRLLQEAKAGRQMGIAPGGVLDGDMEGDDTMIEEAIEVSPCAMRGGGGGVLRAGQAMCPTRCSSH